jgi:hypothetical protein
MSLKDTTVAILLSLILGLSTAVSVAHSHYYHDRISFDNDYSQHDHTLDAPHSEQSRHDKSDCVFTVVQYSESLLAQLIPFISLQIPNVKKAIALLGTRTFSPKNGFFARAPPF